VQASMACRRDPYGINSPYTLANCLKKDAMSGVFSRL
jgi:hypothetical protein